MVTPQMSLLDLTVESDICHDGFLVDMVNDGFEYNM